VWVRGWEGVRECPRLYATSTVASDAPVVRHDGSQLASKPTGAERREALSNGLALQHDARCIVALNKTTTGLHTAAYEGFARPCPD
jgi:hypothetical protein